MENKLTYDVQFNDDYNSNNKGFNESIEYCMDWINANRNDNSTYFGDYRGGTVSIVCNETGEYVYNENI